MARKGLYHDWLTNDGLLQIKGWARDGLTDEQIADKIGISKTTFYDWVNRFADFANALKEGKAPVDIQVEDTLLKSGLGFIQTIRKPVKLKTEKQIAGKGKIIEERIEYVDEEIYIPPQVVALIFWLKNRRPDKWREKPVAVEERAASPIDKITEEIFRLQQQEREAAENDPTEPNNE